LSCDKIRIFSIQQKKRRSRICQEEMEPGPEVKDPEQAEAWVEAAVAEVRAEAVEAVEEASQRALVVTVFALTVVKK